MLIINHLVEYESSPFLEPPAAANKPVDRSADIDAIIEPTVKGGYYYAGQVCVSAQRIFVRGSIKSAFIERFAERVARLCVAGPTRAETEVGPLSIRPKLR